MYKLKLLNNLAAQRTAYFVEVALSLLYLGILNGLYGSSNAQEILKASQCFKSRGIPKVSFDCHQDEMIKINKAFHGIALTDRNRLDNNIQTMCYPNPGQEYANCSHCSGDCVDDSMNMVYDWSTCMGNTTCVRTVMQSYMNACTGLDKFSDYLQVEYQCIPRSSVIDICSETTLWINEGYLMSPNYPEYYPTNMDCSCRIQTDWNSKITISFYDLLLETKQVAGFSGRCRADWLMLRQKKQKHRHCGAIMTGTKNITSEDNVITLQFHSDDNDKRTQNFQYFSRKLKGFWLYFKAEPESTMQVVCRKLTDSDPEVQEIYSDDADYSDVISTKDSLLTSDMETTPSMGKEDDSKDMKDEKDNIRLENEVDSQEGMASSSTSEYKVPIYSLTMILMLYLLH